MNNDREKWFKIRSVLHDSNNFLTTIFGLAGALKEEVLSLNMRREISDQIENAVSQCVDLNRSLLYEECEKSLAHINVGKMIEKIRDMVHVIIKDKYSFILASKYQPFYILGKEEELFSAIYNIIINAFEAMPEGGDVILSCTNESNEEILITIKDTGIGIHDHLLDQIFSPGFSTKNPADKSNKMNLPHFGMGLWAVKDCIETHNGSINVESKVGIGTIFKIKLPVLDS